MKGLGRRLDLMFVLAAMLLAACSGNGSNGGGADAVGETAAGDTAITDQGAPPPWDVPPPVCNAGNKKCMSNGVWQCLHDGSDWELLEQCAGKLECIGGMCFVCQPECGTQECGMDTKCGVSCGECPIGKECISDMCDPCQLDCGDRECGPDPCGLSCGECPDELPICNDDGQCEECVPDCPPWEEEGCGWDDGCGEACACPGGLECIESEIWEKPAWSYCLVTCEFACSEAGECGTVGFVSPEDETEQTCDCGGCDDGNPCTDDACEEVEGEPKVCAFTPNTAECDDGNPCTGPDVCGDGACAGEILPLDEVNIEECVCGADQDCGPLEDGDVCNGTLVCLIEEDADTGLCQVDGESVLVCDDGFDCTDDTCDPVEGCINEPDSGMCDDGNECTEDACEVGVGCQSVPSEDGATCSGEGGVWECLAGECVCVPQCDGKECGDNGCGGECGTCDGLQDVCFGGSCMCAPACDDKECGDDGCDSLCGVCTGPQDECIDGACICQPDCVGKQCGGDGCGGDCGACPENQTCKAGNVCECSYEECAEVCCEWQQFCHEEACVYYIDKPDVVLTFGPATSTTMEIVMENQVPVTSFQFSVSGLSLTGASGGSAAAAGFDIVMGNAGTMLMGVGPGQEEVSAGTATLIVLEFEAQEPFSSLCLGQLSFSKAGAVEVDGMVIPQCYTFE